MENESSGKLPQMYADMMGWPQQVEAVAGVYRPLPSEDQSRERFWQKTTGRPERSIISVRVRPSRMRSAVITTTTFVGLRQYTGEVVIAVGMPLEDLQPIFDQIDRAASITNAYAIPEENKLPVYICRQPKMTLQQAWPRLKFYG